MAADIEAIALVLDGAADAADVARVLFDDRDLEALLGKEIAGGQPRWSRADDGDIDLNLAAIPLQIRETVTHR